MTTFIILIIIISILLMLIILAQNPKQGGLNSNLGGVSQMMGVLRSTDWVEKATWTLIISLFILCISANLFIGQPQTEDNISPNIERAKESGGAIQTAPLIPPTQNIPQQKESTQTPDQKDQLPDNEE